MARYGLVGEATAVGLFFPLAIVAGYLLGKWAGDWLSLGRIPAFAGAVLGVAAAFGNLARFIRRMERRGEDP